MREVGNIPTITGISPPIPLILGRENHVEPMCGCIVDNLQRCIFMYAFVYGGPGSVLSSISNASSMPWQTWVCIKIGVNTCLASIICKPDPLSAWILSIS